jgi:hypothetical protein
MPENYDSTSDVILAELRTHSEMADVHLRALRDYLQGSTIEIEWDFNAYSSLNLPERVIDLLTHILLRDEAVLRLRRAGRLAWSPTFDQEMAMRERDQRVQRLATLLQKWRGGWSETGEAK